MCSVMFVSSTSVYLAVRVVWVSDTVVTGSLPVTLLTRVQKHVLMLAYLFYLSTSTLTLHNNNTTSSNRLFTCVYVRTIRYTTLLLHTLGKHFYINKDTQIDSPGQLVVKKIAFTGFPWGGISPPGSLYRVFSLRRSQGISDNLGVYIVCACPVRLLFVVCNEVVCLCLMPHEEHQHSIMHSLQPPSLLLLHH